MNSLIENKDVILVGPAGYLEQRNDIDGYDVVVRLNKSKPRPGYGSRTDILYCFITSLDHEYYQRGENFKNIKWVVITHGINKWVKRFKSNLPPGVNVRDYNERFYLSVWRECQSKPNTGTVAIGDLLRYPLKTLTVTGVDMFASGHYKGYVSYGQGEHKYDAQIPYLKRLTTDKRLLLDNKLKERLGM